MRAQFTPCFYPIQDLGAGEEGRKLTTREAIEKVTEYLIEREKRLYDEDIPYDLLKKRVEDEQISPSAIEKFNSELNTKITKTRELNHPWHLALMRNPKYTIHPEAIPHVIRVQQFQQLQNLSDEVSIRQAQWIAILYTAVPDITDLYYSSMFYALYENICDLAHIPFDTSKPDRMLPNSEKVKEAFIELLLNGGD